MIKFYFLFFILIFSSVYLGIHFYVYSRITAGLMLSSSVCRYLRLFFLVAAFSFLLGEFLNRRITSFWIKPFAEFGSIWIGVISIAFTIFVIFDVFRIFFHGASFRYYSVVFSLAVTFLTAAYSFYNVAREPVIKELKIRTGKLPQKLSGFVIIQLSDLHINFLKSEKWLNKIVEKTNRENPDLVVITGDLIDADICRLDSFCDVLKKIKSKYGIFAVTGNHEFYAGIDKFLEIAKNSNITVLRNEKTTIADVIELVGIDDKEGRRFSEAGSDLRLALKNCDFTKQVILLSHRPDIFNEAEKSGVGLQLSGHLHAGQIPPMDLIVMLAFKYPYGLYRQNGSYLYTTSGTGIWGPPMRLFSRCEIVKIVLE
ncbi:MAG: metallophosphoesterase [Elusimicrobiota bacterium]|nr:metallophosphoesterase [Elusimicrobiota bacterium]